MEESICCRRRASAPRQADEILGVAAGHCVLRPQPQPCPQRCLAWHGGVRTKAQAGGGITLRLPLPWGHFGRIVETIVLVTGHDEAAGKPFGEPSSCARIPHIGVGEPFRRCRNIADKLDITRHLLLIRVVQRLEHAVDELGHEPRERDRPQHLPGRGGDLVRGDARELAPGVLGARHDGTVRGERPGGGAHLAGTLVGKLECRVGDADETRGDHPSRIGIERMKGGRGLQQIADDGADLCRGRRGNGGGDNRHLKWVRWPRMSMTRRRERYRGGWFHRWRARPRATRRLPQSPGDRAR
jgi:hypothetical protein